ncbi:MAG: GGDEF domain-containing protein [Halanaerobium sp.]|nr:GGDEF domain-containing protein [Halanaerobium sp.]
MIDSPKFDQGRLEEKLLLYGVPIIGLAIMLVHLPSLEIFLNPDYLLFMSLIVISNLLAIMFPLKGMYLSLNFPFVFCILILQGPYAAMWSCVPAALIYMKKLNLKSVIYNMGQIAISIYVAALILPDNLVAILAWPNFLRIILAALLSDLINFYLVIRILCLQQGMSFYNTFVDVWVYKMWPIRPLQYSAGIIMAICYQTQGYGGLLLATVPVLGLFYLLNTMSRLQEETVRARTDNVTKAGNRYALTLWWKENYPAIRDAKKDLSVLMIDIDQFQKIEQLYGLDIGDQVLKTVAKIIEGCLEPGHSLFRYDKDEFYLLMPETGVNAAKKVAWKITSAIFEAEIAPLEKNAVTVSVGLSHLTPELLSEEKRLPGELLRRADQAMYLAKKNQLGNVHVYS